MNTTVHNNLVKVWEYIEQNAQDAETPLMREVRLTMSSNGHTPGSAAQAAFIAQQVRLMNAQSVILLGTESIIEILHVMNALSDGAQLTVVDPSARGSELTRSLVTKPQDSTHAKLRNVNANAATFLPKLNAGDYDLIIVAGDVENYEPAINEATRLLHKSGELILTDVLALMNNDSNGGVPNPADRSTKAVAMREIIASIPEDERYTSSLMPVGTGLFLSVKN